jgi:putative restriction endonuclease
MRYWWVSQNQTFEHEVTGGYMWSPKANSNGSLNHFYENMREVSQGDIVFSFKGRKIMAMGIALGPAYTCPKPTEFGSSGANWNNVGWRVDVSFHVLGNPIEPRQHMELLRPLLSDRYSPIRSDGTGNQMYLAEISNMFASALIGLIGYEAIAIEQDSSRNQSGVAELNPTSLENNPLLKQWDEVQIEKIRHDTVLTETEKEQTIKSRRGQGLFRNRVAEREKYCRITRVERPEHLIASHIKPWRVAENNERLDGENGLFLTPTIDHLFNDGYISFRDNGGLIISPVAHTDALIKMGVPTGKEFDCGTFTRQQAEYLEYHRDKILLKARG